MFGWSDAPDVFSIGSVIGDVLNIIFRALSLLWHYTPIVYVFVAAGAVALLVLIINLFKR